MLPFEITKEELQEDYEQEVKKVVGNKVDKDSRGHVRGQQDRIYTKPSRRRLNHRYMDANDVNSWKVEYGRLSDGH